MKETELPDKLQKVQSRFSKDPQTDTVSHPRQSSTAKVHCSRANADGGTSRLILSCTLVLKLRLVN